MQHMGKFETVEMLKLHVRQRIYDKYFTDSYALKTADSCPGSQNEMFFGIFLLKGTLKTHIDAQQKF